MSERRPFHLGLFAGTRPEIIKAAALCHAEHRDVRVHLVLTGQHYDEAMATSFLRSLKLTPVATLAYPKGDVLAGMLSAARALIANPAAHGVAGFDAIAAIGDTSTVAIAALTSLHAQLPFIHVEAGLRSGNRVSLEEGHRKMAAALAALNLAPTISARDNLLAEGVPQSRVAVVGNTVIDALDSFALPRPAARTGVLFTAHRASNVDDPARLSRLVDVAFALAERYGAVRWPLHPRTAAALGPARVAALAASGLAISGPLEYRDMLEAINGSLLVVTDSGGVQEEAARFAVPLVVMRTSTPRPEGVRAGISALAGVDPDRVLAACDALLADNRCEDNVDIYGDGTAGIRCLEAVSAARRDGLLALSEPVLS